MNLDKKARKINRPHPLVGLYCTLVAQENKPRNWCLLLSN